MKKILNYKPFGFLGCLLVGINLQFYVNIWCFSFGYLMLTLIILVFILLLLKQYNRALPFTITTLFFFIFLGISSVYTSDPINRENHFSKLVEDNSSLVLSISKVLKPDNYYDKYIVDVIQTDKHKTLGKLLINIKKDSISKPFTLDDLLYVKPDLKDIASPLNPYQFNYKAYLAKQYVYQQTFLTTTAILILKEKQTSFKGVIASFRNKIQSSLQNHSFSKNEYAVINALLLGQKQQISKEVLSNYTKAGAIHILAISGLHVGIVLLFLSWVLYPLEKIKHGKLFKTIIIVGFLWMFTFLTGLSASVVRAVTMFTFITVGTALKKGRNTEFSIITSAFVLLLIEPMFLFDVGFQLSYLAVISIIYIQPILNSLWKPHYFILRKLWQLITVSIAAQMGILPLSLYYFHQFPGLFLLTNMIIIPFLGIILFCGIIIILLSLGNILPERIVIAYNSIIKWMNFSIEWIAKQEEFLFTKISLSLLMMLVLYALLITSFRFIIQKTVKPLIATLLLVIVLQLTIVFEKYQLNNTEALIVFHKNRKSVLGKRKGSNFLVYHNLGKQIVTQNFISAYEITENISSHFKEEKPLLLKYKQQEILIIDSLCIYQLKGLKKPVIILQNSPKINLDRVIKKLNPKEIIADGSNYKSYVNSWKKTCEHKKTPFYYTGKNGAYIFN